jgi:hypothetical protein
MARRSCACGNKPPRPRAKVLAPTKKGFGSKCGMCCCGRRAIIRVVLDATMSSFAMPLCKVHVAVDYDKAKRAAS